MSSSAIVDTLDQVTGSWKPIATATSGDLDSARHALATALASGVPASALHATPSVHAPVVTAARSAIDALVRNVNVASSATVLPNVRNAIDIDPAAGALVAGMKIEKTLGPFVDAIGALHWIDLIPLPKKLPITGSTAGELGFVIVADPASGIVLPLGATLRLELMLAPPAGGALTPQIGADAQAMTLALPSTVMVEFTAAGAAITSVGTMSATVYGSSFTLQRNAAKPRTVTAGLRYAVFPCDVSLAAFSLKGSQRDRTGGALFTEREIAGRYRERGGGHHRIRVGRRRRRRSESRPVEPRRTATPHPARFAARAGRAGLLRHARKARYAFSIARGVCIPSAARLIEA